MLVNPFHYNNSQIAVYPKRIAFKSDFAVRNQSLSHDVVMFKGNNSIDDYHNLPQQEKERILGTITSIFNREKNAKLVALNKKPASLIMLYKEESDTLAQYKNLLESENIKILLDNHGKNGYYTSFMINISGLKKVVDKNLDFYRFKLNNDKLTSDEVLKILTSEKSPLLNDKREHDLLGVTIGYPVADTLVFNTFIAAREALNMVKKEDSPEHQKLLEHILRLLRPDVYKDNPSEQRPDLAKAQNSERYFQFMTWDKEHPEYLSIMETVKDGLDEADSKFASAEDFLNYLIELKK